MRNIAIAIATATDRNPNNPVIDGDDTLVTPPLLTINDVLTELNAGRETVGRLMRKGELPYIKIGRAVRFRRSDVERLKSTGGRTGRHVSPRAAAAAAVAATTRTSANN